MRLLLFVLLATALTAPISPPHRIKETHKADEHKAIPERPESLPDQRTFDTQPKEQKATYKTYDLYSAVAPETWASWGVVLVTLLAVRVAMSTLDVIERQTNATEVAANAAKASAEALNNIERPWLLLTRADRDGDWNFKNFGNTPAFIDEVAATLDILEKPEEVMTGEPQYVSDCFFKDDPVLAPNTETTRITTTWHNPLSDEAWARILKRELHIVLYGMIRYHDPFGLKHESRFGYVFDFNLNRFKPCGSKKYNQYS